jgi:hypothetical protein
MKFELTPRQVEGIRKRFGATVDLKKEFRAAKEYCESIHTGRPYKNVGRFFWNWCLRAEAWKEGAAAGLQRTRKPRPGEMAGICGNCGRLRTAAVAPNPGTDTHCGWCGHDEIAGSAGKDVS